MLVFGKEIATNISEMPVDDVVARLSRGEDVFGLMLIVVGLSEGRMLEILSAREAAKPHYADMRLKVVGMAFGEMEARILVMDMLREWLLQNGDVAACKAYYMNMEVRA